MGFAERFGQVHAARLSLDPERFLIETRTEDAFDWPLETLTAIQPSSKTLQLNHADGLVSIRFLGDSVRRWEALLQRYVRERWALLGRGRVAEFQPRIVAL